MDLTAELLIPIVLTVVSCLSMAGKRDIYSLLVRGAGNGLTALKQLIPPLVILLTAVHMLRASGALSLLTALLTPFCRRIGIPPETVPLILIRPVSGSAALAIGSELIASCGPDSLAGRTAAVMLGSTETTFYVVSVYFGSAGIRQSRHAIPAALIADLAGFLAASWVTRWRW